MSRPFRDKIKSWSAARLLTERARRYRFINNIHNQIAEIESEICERRAAAEEVDDDRHAGDKAMQWKGY